MRISNHISASDSVPREHGELRRLRAVIPYRRTQRRNVLLRGGLAGPALYPTPKDPDADVHSCVRVRQYCKAVELLLPRYRDRVFRLCLSILRDPTHAEDVTQEVFVRVWRALPGYSGQASLSTWIYAITRNACLSELRKCRPHVSLEGSQTGFDAEVAALAAPIQDYSAVHSVSGLLDQLPQRYRQAVTLFYIEDRSYQQTALRLGMPLGTVKAVLHRARKRLIELAGETSTVHGHLQL